MAAISERSDSLDSGASKVRRMRCCTARSAASLAVQRLEVGDFGVHALHHHAQLGAALAAQATQFQQLFGLLAAAVGHPAAGPTGAAAPPPPRPTSPAVPAGAAAVRWPAPIPAAAGGWPPGWLRRRSAARPALRAPTRQTRAVAAHPASRSAQALMFDLRLHFAIVPSGSSSASILLSTTKRSWLAWPRWSRQMVRSERVTPVSAASTKTTAWARRQQAQRQLGLGADGVQALACR
jgi:hypothetical protein